jgi:hypothetical protein
VIQLSAIPTNGYRFVNWTENGIAVTNTNTFTFAFAGYRSLVANFSSTAPFNIDSLDGNPVSGLTIHWTGWAGYGYQMQYSASLQAEDWHASGCEQTVLTGQAPMSYTNLPPVGEERRFYRVVRTVQP